MSNKSKIIISLLILTLAIGLGVFIGVLASNSSNYTSNKTNSELTQTTETQKQEDTSDKQSTLSNEQELTYANNEADGIIQADYYDSESVFMCYTKERFTIDYNTIDDHYNVYYNYLIGYALDKLESNRSDYIYKVKAKKEITTVSEIEITERKLNLTVNIEGTLREAAIYKAIVRVNTNGEDRTILVKGIMYSIEGVWYIDSYHEEEI
ncbi:MAG: hypothetical protein AB2417_14625 [Clostridiaceae bacterium]